MQFNDPDYKGGANFYSLRQSQHKYANGYRAKYNDPKFEKDPNWALLPEKSDKKNTADFQVDSSGNASNT